MPRWFGKRRRDKERAAAVDALLGAAQERGIPTMRVDDPDEVAIHDREMAPVAMVNLATIVMGRGDLAEAERLLRAVETGSPRWAPRAAFNLGGVLAMRGRNDEAEAAFRRAVDWGHPDDAPGALTYLAAL